MPLRNVQRMIDTPRDIIMGALALTGMATILVLATMAIYELLIRWYNRGK